MIDKAFSNVKGGHRTEKLQERIRSEEMIESRRCIPGTPDATQLLQSDKYFRYMSPRNTGVYKMAEAKIHNLLAGRD